MQVEELRTKLRVYRALDNAYRLEAFITILKDPGVSFNEIARRIKVERGLLGYHLGVLKSAGLVTLALERRSKKTSHYEVTEKGKKILKELSASAKQPKEPKKA